MNTYSPAIAHAMEAHLAANWKPAEGAGKLPRLPNASWNDLKRIEDGERKKQELLSHVTNEWQGAMELAKKSQHNTDAMRSAVDNMIRMGRLEGRKHRGKTQVRLPQVTE